MKLSAALASRRCGAYAAAIGGLLPRVKRKLPSGSRNAECRKERCTAGTLSALLRPPLPLPPPPPLPAPPLLPPPLTSPMAGSGGVPVPTPAGGVMRMEAPSRHSLRETVTTGPEALAAAPWHLRSVLAWTECSLLAGWSGISASAKSAESGGDGGEGIKECCSGGRCCSCSCLKAAAACAGCTGTGGGHGEGGGGGGK